MNLPLLMLSLDTQSCIQNYRRTNGAGLALGSSARLNSVRPNGLGMKFLVIERVRGSAISSDPAGFAKTATDELKYKLQLERKKKIVGGGPFLDTLGVGYILETETIEELGELFFNSPANMITDREVHPLGTFSDSLEGMGELGKKRK